MFIIDTFGSISAAELDWGNEDHIKAVGPPFDFIIGTDVVSLNDYFRMKHNGASFNSMLSYDLQSKQLAKKAVILII